MAIPPSEFSEELSAFDHWLQQFALRESSRKLYMTAVRAMLKGVKEVTEYEINSFLRDHQRVYFRTAVNYYLRFKKIKDWDIIRVSDPPAKPQERPEHKHWLKILPKIKNAGEAFRDLYWTSTTLCYCGARFNEALSLCFKHLDLKNCQIILENTGRSIKKQQMMPFPRNLLMELHQWLSNEKGVLAEDRCFYTSYARIQYAYNQYREEVAKLVRAGILTEEEGRFIRKSHTFRRSWTDMMFDIAKDDIVAVADARRDQDIRTTLRYRDTLKREKKSSVVKKKLIEVMQNEQ